jgi:hypothetical protein
MRALVVLTVELPSPEAIVEVLDSIDPPNVKHFAGDARIVVEPATSAVLAYLDGE